MVEKCLALGKDYRSSVIQTETMMKGLQQFSTSSKLRNPIIITTPTITWPFDYVEVSSFF